MKEHKCHFHKNVSAQSKCVQCGTFICLDCTQKKGTCPVCNQKNVESQYGPSMAIGMGIFALFCLIIGIVSVSLGDFGFFFLIFSLIICILVGSLLYYVYVKSAPREKEKARKILEQAQQALRESEGQEPYDDEEQDGKNGRVELTCRFCGGSIKQGDTTCKYCGTSWVWKNT